MKSNLQGIVVLWVVLLGAVSSFSQTDLIKNGSFSGGTTNWNLGQYGGSSSGGVTNGEYRILVTTAGSEHWHVQFTQSALSLVQGKRYVFSFDAYKGAQNSGTQSMQINVGKSSSPYTSYYGTQNNMVTLTTTKTACSFSFTMAGATDANARIEFNCGKSTGSFYIDNIRLYEDVAATPLLSAAPVNLDFGDMVVGGSKQLMVTLQNTGSAPTAISAIQSSSGSFTIGLATPVTVAAVGSVVLPVTFTPAAAGVVSGTVTIYSNASDHPTITIPVSGAATLPGIACSPQSFSFSTAQGVAQEQTLVLVNSGTTPVSWSAGSSSSWVTIAPSAGSIPGNAQATCKVTATSATLGSFSGELLITHAAANQPSPITIPLSLVVAAGYQPTSQYIQHPEMAVDFIRNIATFRSKQRDNTNGGYYTNIDRQGNPTSANEKALCGQSRIAYAFVRAFMVTGDEQYLEMAHHALKFLYDHGWNNGWYFITDLKGNYISHWGHNDWWSFQQHYALVGITAMVEATGGKKSWNDGSESDLAWLMRGVNSNYTRLWDANPSTKGYFDRANTAWNSKWGKGFTATVDGITTHALLLALMYDSLNHKQKLVDLATNAAEHLVGSMSIAKAGFPEVYNSDWSIDYSNTSMDIGHGYKTAWVLQRAYLLHPEHPEYRTAAQALMQNLYDHGTYDDVNGGPFTYLNWQTGAITGKNKDFWMVEQGYTSGMTSYYTATTQAQRDLYLKIADGSINFFMNHQMDPVYGEAYSVVNADGSSIVDGSKGGLFTAGYHSSELGYYAYLYGSLYYQKKPVQLYYLYPAENAERNIKLTPLTIEDNLLKVVDVTLDGAVYTDFNSDTRTIHLPAGVGGKLKVTFGFAPVVTHTITATAAAGGSISPAGAITVSDGNSATFTIASAPGYRVGDVVVDGVSAGAVATHTFSNVTADHTIAASFTPLPTYTVTATVTEGGTIDPAGAVSVHEHANATFTIAPAAGYRIGDVMIDGVSNGAVSSHTFTNIIDNHTITAQFIAVPTFTITATAGSNGSITPTGSVTLTTGASQTFTIAPAAGYTISAVTVDGTAAGTPASYTFTSITSSHTINATFAALPSTIYQINCGGSASSPFTKDQYYSGGTARTVTSTITTTGVTNPAPQTVYRTERYGTSTYTLPNLTAGSAYTVRLHFAELYQTASGKRKFNVVINGTTVLSNFDIFAVTGARYKAVVREFTATANASGQIVINFTTITDNATIEGIEIIRQ